MGDGVLNVPAELQNAYANNLRSSRISDAWLVRHPLPSANGAMPLGGVQAVRKLNELRSAATNLPAKDEGEEYAPSVPVPGDNDDDDDQANGRSEEHTSELQSLMRI